MILTISHHTTYRYDEPVPHALQQMRLTPKSGPGQTVLNWSTEVLGGNLEVSYDDHHANLVELYSFSTTAPDTTIEVVSEGVVETSDISGVRDHASRVPLWLFRRPTPLTTVGPLVKGLTDGLAPAGDIDANIADMHELSRRIAEAVTYTTGSTDVASTAEEAVEAGVGVCQDHAQIFVAAARELGFGARYVSGYLMMEGTIEQAASHAWAEVYQDRLGWVGFDVSNGISPDERYVRIATGLDYRDAAPISGLRKGGGAEHLGVTLTVEADAAATQVQTDDAADPSGSQQAQMQQSQTEPTQVAK